MASRLRLATAQSTVPDNPYDRAALRAAGAEIRRLMTEAAEAGARLVLRPPTSSPPGGAWSARCAADGRPGLVVADLDRDPEDPDVRVAVRFARPWRRSVRSAWETREVWEARETPEIRPSS